jgi:hypothetical protein
MTEDTNQLISMFVILLAASGWSWLMYNKGRRDEQFDKKYCCIDCGDFRDDDLDGMCRDCRHKYYGEISQ